MAEVPEAPEGVVDQESADDYLDGLFSGDEPPESETEAPDEEESAQPTDDDGPARDDQGRFASPDDVEADPAPEAEEPSPDAPGPESDAPEEGTPPADGQLSDEEWAALPSMQYKADGQMWQIVGSKVEDDGVFIPTDQIPNVAQLLSEGQSHRGSFRTTLAGYTDEITNLTAELEGERASNQAYADKIEELVSTPGALEAWVEDQRKNWDTLKLGAELAKSKRATEHAEGRRASIEATREEELLLPQMRGRVSEAIEAWGPQAGFDLSFMQKLYTRFTTPEALERLFPKGEDGKRAENLESLREEMLFLVTASGRSPTAEPTPVPGPEQPKPAPVARRKRRKPPTTVASSAGKDETPAKTPQKPPKFKTAEEADAWFEAGGYNDLE